MPNCILQCTIHYIGMDKLFNSINGSAANNIFILYLLLGTFHLFFHFILFSTYIEFKQQRVCVCVSGPSLHVHRRVRRTAPPVKKKKKKKSSRYYVGCQYANHFTLSLPARRRCSTVYLLKSIASATM